MKAESSMRLLRLCSITSARHMSEAAARHGAGHQLLMVVGLGNYGMSGTRHNVGMDALNLLARRLNIAELWKKDKQCGADIIQSGIGQARLVLLKPRHFMNINGKSVGSAAGRFCVIPENICLLHDDLDKPLGKLSLKFGGSARGHNGVRSCIDSLQSDSMARLRIGIGRPADNTSVERYVLGRFTRNEQELLTAILERSVDMVMAHIMQRCAIAPPGNLIMSKKERNEPSKP